MTDQVVNVILQLRAPEFEFLDLLVGREINLLLDAIDRVVEAMVFVEHIPEMIVAAFQAADDFTMFRKLSQDGMMEVHEMSGWVNRVMGGNEIRTHLKIRKANRPSDEPNCGIEDWEEEPFRQGHRLSDTSLVRAF